MQGIGIWTNGRVSGMNYTNISMPMRYNNERYMKAGLACDNRKVWRSIVNWVLANQFKLFLPFSSQDINLIGLLFISSFLHVLHYVHYTHTSMSVCVHTEDRLRTLDLKNSSH